MLETPPRQNPRGENHPRSRLSDADILRIRKLRRDGHSLRQIARQYDITHTHVAHIVKGRRWGHLVPSL